MTSALEGSANISADGALGTIPIPTDPPLPEGERLQQVRDGIAAGRNMGQLGEIVQIIDAVYALRAVDQQIINAIQLLTGQATTAITQLRTDATDAIVNTNKAVADTRQAATVAIAALREDATQAIAAEAAARATAVSGLRTEAVDAISTLRSDTTTAVTGEASTRAAADTSLNTSIGTVNTNATNAFVADRARLTTIENAIATPTTGITARITKLEQRLATAGIA